MRSKKIRMDTKALCNALNTLKSMNKLVSNNNRVLIQDIFDLIFVDDTTSHLDTFYWEIVKIELLRQPDGGPFDNRNEFRALNIYKTSSGSKILINDEGSINFSILPSGVYYFRRRARLLKTGRTEGVSCRIVINFESSQFHFSPNRVELLDIVKKYINS